MPRSKQNYLRRERRSWALRQKDLAFLLGIKTTTHISRLEHSRSIPNIKTGLAFEVIFGLSPGQLLPALFSLIEEEVMARAATMHKRLSERLDARAVRKRQLCEALLKRATTRSIRQQE